MMTYTPKTPEENLILGMNFKRLLSPGETVLHCDAKMLDSQGVDVSADMLDLIPDITSQPILKQRVKGGTSGETYVLELTAVTSYDQTIVGQVKLPVSDGQ